MLNIYNLYSIVFILFHTLILIKQKMQQKRQQKRKQKMHPPWPTEFPIWCEFPISREIPNFPSGVNFSSHVKFVRLPMGCTWANLIYSGPPMLTDRIPHHVWISHKFHTICIFLGGGLLPYIFPKPRTSWTRFESLLVDNR